MVASAMRHGKLREGAQKEGEMTLNLLQYLAAMEHNGVTSGERFGDDERTGVGGTRGGGALVTASVRGSEHGVCLGEGNTMVKTARTGNHRRRRSTRKQRCWT